MPLFRTLLLLLILPLAIQAAVPAEWLTPFELSDSLETPTYDETLAYSLRLDRAVPQLSLRTIAVTPGEWRDLFYLYYQPTAAQTGEARMPLVVIIAGIHAGEIDGKDAGLMFLRDALILKKWPGLLESVRIAFFPIFNIDGHERRSRYSRMNQRGPLETGWRTTAENINLNRDWLKTDAIEMRAMVKELAELDPELLVDIHVTDGSDFQYTLTYGLNNHEDAPPPLREVCDQRLLPTLQSRMMEMGWEMPRYVSFREWRRMESGWVSEIPPPRFSNGYGTLLGRPALLIETHSLKPYARRVRAVYDLLYSLCETVRQEAHALIDAGKSCDALASNLTGRWYPLNWELTADSQLVEFKGYEFHRELSPMLGDSVIRWSDVPKSYTLPFFSQSKAVDSVRIPYGYLIPSAWFSGPLAEGISAHGIPYEVLTKAMDLEIESYRFDSVTFAARPYEGHQRAEFVTVPTSERRHFPEGTIWIKLNHATAPIAIHLLEPDAPDSYLRWGFMNRIFEQKEYAEDYVIDTLATRWLVGSPGLKADFESRLMDSSFATNPEARLQFLFEHSPYWDSRKDVYPIARVTTAEGLQQVESMPRE